MGTRSVGHIQPFAKALMSPLFRAAWRVRTEGEGNIPRRGGAILAANHTSVLDSFFVPLALDRRITYVGKAEYLDDWKTRRLFPAMGMIPIDRSGGDSASSALDAAADVLEAGELFGIYPEGTRSRTGKLHKGHTGVARLALRTNTPIIPVGILGAVAIQPPEAKAPRCFMELLIRFGAPIDTSRYGSRSNDRLVLRQITDEVMYEIRQLSEQDYVDEYATKTPDSIPRETTSVTSTHAAVDVEGSSEPTEPDGTSSSAVLSTRPQVELVDLT